MKYILLTTLLIFVSCATVVKPQNFTLNTVDELPQNKKSLSISVFQKLYNEEGEFYGHGYQSELTEMFVKKFKATNAFSSVSSLTSTCSESYICLDIPTSKKIRKQRHVNIILPKKLAEKTYTWYSQVLSVITLGLFPASYDLKADWEISMVNSKREELYLDDTIYIASAKNSVLNHIGDGQIKNEFESSKADFFDKVAVRIINNIIFQIKRFP